MANINEIARIVVGQVLPPNSVLGRRLVREVARMEGVEPGQDFAQIRRRATQQINEKAGTDIKPADVEALGTEYFRSKPGVKNMPKLTRTQLEQ